jgi:hypothetical protein
VTSPGTGARRPGRQGSLIPLLTWRKTMTHQHDRKAQAILDNLKNAHRNTNDGAATLLARVALSVVYMYLILMSYEMLGISGPVFVSVLFLIAFFIPLLYQRFVGRLQKRSDKETQYVVTDEARQES